MQKPIIYAHRGASGHCPENTMASFQRAAQLGANGIETDVQMTKDGALVLIHDETLKRTTDGEGKIKNLTLQEIKAFDAGSWYGPEFAGEKIPVLSELFELAEQNELYLNIEIKSNGSEYHGIEEKLIAMILRYNFTDKVIISSFNHYSLANCKQLEPKVKTGILYSNRLYRPWKYAGLVQADALHPKYTSLNSSIVQKARANGTIVNAWTVNDIRLMQNLLELGVDGMITDYPDRLRELLD